jgi:caa(3)-type oxidase subunit IV
MVKTEKRLFFFSYLGLIALLVGTVIIYKLSLGWLGILLSLLIAVAKATLVMRNFMELRHAQTAVLWFLGGTLFLVYVATLLSFSDYLTRAAS